MDFHTFVVSVLVWTLIFCCFEFLQLSILYRTGRFVRVQVESARPRVLIMRVFVCHKRCCYQRFAKALLSILPKLKQKSEISLPVDTLQTVCKQH